MRVCVAALGTMSPRLCHPERTGSTNGGCDDAQTSLNVDWDENSVNYTCFNPTTPFMPDETVESLLHCDNVPKNFLPSKN